MGGRIGWFRVSTELLSAREDPWLSAMQLILLRCRILHRIDGPAVTTYLAACKDFRELLPGETVPDYEWLCDERGGKTTVKAREIELPAKPALPSNQQIGGDHYRSMAIQPAAYIFANDIPFAEGNVIKYVSRWRAKGGLEDLRKARHTLDMLIEMEEGRQAP